MSNDKFETKIVTNVGTIHFQEYLVKGQAKDKIKDVVFEGASEAQPTPGVIDAISKADAVIVCPSNPVVSIGTILAIEGVRGALRETSAKVIAVSPIVGGAPIKGPADKLMQGLDLEVSACSVARIYQDFLDFFVLDQADAAEKERVERLGLRTIVTNTIMKRLCDKIQLARAVLELIAP